MSQVLDGLVVFSSPTCEPCKVLKAKLKEKDIPYTEVNVTEKPVLGRQYGIRSVPTTMVFNHGLPDGFIRIGMFNINELS